MDLKIISELVKMMDSSKLSSLEVESKELRVRLEKNAAVNVSASLSSDRITNKESKQNSFAAKEEYVASVKEEALSTTEKALDLNLKDDAKVMKSPIVGTFYASSAPDKDAFVAVGKKVKKGEVLCIVEAMKLMNEIESEFDGEVVEILVANGSMVEYGQPLFKIK